jgi:hypothetical protein
MAKNTGPQRHPGNSLSQGVGAGNEPAPKAKRSYLRPPSPGMGCAGSEHPGEHQGGLYTPRPESDHGAAEALNPHDPYGEGQGSGERPRGRLPRSISNRY